MRCDVDGNLYITRHGKGTVVEAVAARARCCARSTCSAQRPATSASAVRMAAPSTSPKSNIRAWCSSASIGPAWNGRAGNVRNGAVPTSAGQEPIVGKACCNLNPFAAYARRCQRPRYQTAEPSRTRASSTDSTSRCAKSSRERSTVMRSLRGRQMAGFVPAHKARPHRPTAAAR